MSRSICFLSTSLWEDPGFVLIEAGFCRSTIISSDCKNGPEEILMNGKSGYLFQSNNLESLVSTLKIFILDKYCLGNCLILKTKFNLFFDTIVSLKDASKNS